MNEKTDLVWDGRAGGWVREITFDHKAHSSAPFLRGPVPLAWLRLAAKHKASSTAILVWYAKGLQKTINGVVLRPKYIQQLSLDRKTVYRQLERLEDAGLLRVHRHRGRAPLVDILDAPQ